ncbi:hypothetical protein LTS08_005653 [Lithohypha guttulata]|uniref:uncharacterized protein n=1 Tax=Lithohypha guttulata TaxID=1690604 RepID=UPI002DDF2DA1|nr:hypothetical protein LTR51_003177 [Lithohypha guttulata]KAK5099938.1 hypothetical protein LTS08_005653 [Lithohypha guttulata]
MCSASAAAISSPCPLAGPDFQAPHYPSNTTSVQRAVQVFKQSVATALSNSSSVFALDPNGTTFSFEAWSIHETAPIYNFHHNAELLAAPEEGVVNVTSDTTYRLGSLSKLLTVYTWLAAVGDEHWFEPITNFIPEFEAYDAQRSSSTNHLDQFRWSDITIAALANQLSGIQKDPALPKALFTQLTPIPNLPSPVDLPIDAQGLNCTTYSFLPCTRTTYLNSVLVSHPVYAPETLPVYSDMAYSLLAFALENITGSSFNDIFANHLIKPLNLTSTYTEAPTDLSNSIIPINDSVAVFTPSLSYLQPGGGFYSSLNDISAIGRSMLSHTLLSPRLTRQWMKPSSFLPDGKSAVGAPWEIYQALGTNKTTWMYTKSGDLGAYSTYLILLPDYDAGFTILTAGMRTASVSRILADIAATAFVPAFESAAREEASTRFTGEFAFSGPNAAGNGTDTFEIVLSIDDGPGLLVANYSINGVDMRTAFAALARTTANNTQLRLYPSGLTAPGEQGTVLQGYRMIRYNPNSMAPTPDGAVFSSPRCQEWFNIGGYTSRMGYGAQGGLDEFAMVVGEGGEGVAQGLVVKTWDKVLAKVG